MKKQALLRAGLLLLSVATLAACQPNSETISTTSGQVVAQQVSQPQIDWTSLPSKEVTLSEQGLTITEAGTYILKGETTAGVTVKTSGNVRIILAGAKISASDGPAIYVEQAENVQIELQDGSQNTVTDSSTHSNEDLEGAIHAKSNLILTGKGSLSIEAKYQDGIVSRKDLFIQDGSITVTAADDAIRGKDSVNITGGKLDITAQGDGIKSNNDEDTRKGTVTIDAGDITAKVGDDGIKAESSLTINGGNIDIQQSVEGLEGSNITINGGTLKVYATDDGINAASDIQGANIFIAITGGDIQVEVGPGDTDAIDSNGDLTISGGTVSITAQSAFDYDGQGNLTGGSVTVNGEKVSQLTQTGPGAGGGFEGGIPEGQEPPSMRN